MFLVPDGDKILDSTSASMISESFKCPPQRAGLCDIDGAQLFHRGDDLKATVRHRIEAYQHDTAPMIEHYRESGALYTVNADRPQEEVAEEIGGLLEFKIAA
jgi:adenylate kinase